MKLSDLVKNRNNTEHGEQYKSNIDSFPVNRRKFLTTLSAAGIGSVAGCSAIPEEYDTYEMEEEIPADFVWRSDPMTSPRACELEYSCEIESSDEGFEEEATADVLIMTESSDQRASIGQIDSQSPLIEGPSRFDVTGSVEESGPLDAGIYRILVRNVGGSRTLTADIDAALHSREPDRDTSDCNDDSPELEVRHLEIYHDPEGLVEERVLLYHIIVHGATDGAYEMSMTLMTDKDERSISGREESNVCGTHFVKFDDAELDVNDGFFERNEEVRAQITITKAGSTVAETEVTFTATVVN